MFNLLSLSLVIYIMGFVNIDGSYDVSPLYTLVVMIESLPFEVLSCRIEYSDMRTHDVCLAVRIYGDNGIPRDSLDVCFGDKLAGSAHEPMHRG